MKIITYDDIRSLRITPCQCVEWVKESFSIKHMAQLPAKISVHPRSSDFFTSMPCLLPRDAQGSFYFGIKEVHRIKGAVPSLGSDMMLYDADTGILLAMLDCNWITAMRTGAVAALSAQLLRRTDSHCYSFIGLGNTARATLLCTLDSEPDKQFYVKLMKYKDQAELFIDRFRDKKNVTFEVCDDIDNLIDETDVLFSCITDAEGLIVEDENQFKPGITIIPIHMRGFQNCDRSFDRVFGDDTDHISGFQYFNQFNDYNEIGEVLIGNDPGRRNDRQRIIDYNYGLAIHDVLFAAKIFNEIKHKPSIDVRLCDGMDKFWI